MKLKNKYDLFYRNILSLHFLREHIHLRSVPGNKAFPVSISAIMQPTDHISTEMRENAKYIQSN